MGSSCSACSHTERDPGVVDPDDGDEPPCEHSSSWLPWMSIGKLSRFHSVSARTRRVREMQRARAVQLQTATRAYLARREVSRRREARDGPLPPAPPVELEGALVVGWLTKRGTGFPHSLKRRYFVASGDSGLVGALRGLTSVAYYASEEHPLPPCRSRACYCAVG